MIKNIQFHAGDFSRKLPAPQEMAELDRLTIAGGVPSLDLMQKAGAEVAKIILNRYQNSLNRDKYILILCGPGNNGGDGFVIAKELEKAGYQCLVLLVSASKYSEDLIAKAKEWEAARGRTCVFPEKASNFPLADLEVVNEEGLSKLIQDSQLLVDALLGTGQESAPRSNIGSIVEYIFKEKEKGRELSPCVAVDMPTGLNACTGELYKPYFPAEFTIAIQLLKRGLVQYPARVACGNIEVVDIGIDCAPSIEFSYVDQLSVPRMKRRSPDAHKGHFGHVLIVGGSKNMPGAPYLAALGALRAGAGLVSVATLESMGTPPISPELMLHVVEDGGEGVFNEKSIVAVIDKLADIDAIVIGPGLGQAEVTRSFLLALLEAVSKQGIRGVLDADGLNLLSVTEQTSLPALDNMLITPHPGEASRLLGKEVSKVQEDRYASVKELYRAFNCVSVLKGAATLIYGGDGRGYVNSTGNPYMATGGSGDVLSGTIAALLASGINIEQAAVQAVYIHGLAGDLAYQKSKGPLITSDIVDEIPRAVAQIMA